MWQELLTIPHPSLNDLIKSSEVVVALYPLHILMRVLESEAQKEKRRIREYHKKHHREHARWCRHGDCSKLSSQSLPQYLSQEVQVSVPVQLEDQVPQSAQETDQHLFEVSL